MHHNSVVVHWNSQWNAAWLRQCSSAPQLRCGAELLLFCATAASQPSVVMQQNSSRITCC